MYLFIFYNLGNNISNFHISTRWRSYWRPFRITSWTPTPPKPKMFTLFMWSTFPKYCATEKAQWMICNPSPRPSFYKRFENHGVKPFFSFFLCTWMSSEQRLIIRRRFLTYHSKGNQPNKLSIFMPEGLI